MNDLHLTPVGVVRVNNQGTAIHLFQPYVPALRALDGFGHLQVLWWFDGFDTPEARSILETPKPYAKAPDTMGIFATRSPVRPNPIGLSVVQVLHIDVENGIAHIAYIDANDGSPVLDLKPYTPSLDRVETPRLPDWCAHWPLSVEASGDFDWESEFLF